MGTSAALHPAQFSPLSPSPPSISFLPSFLPSVASFPFNLAPAFFFLLVIFVVDHLPPKKKLGEKQKEGRSCPRSDKSEIKVNQYISLLSFEKMLLSLCTPFVSPKFKSELLFLFQLSLFLRMKQTREE